MLVDERHWASVSSLSESLVDVAYVLAIKHDHVSCGVSRPNSTNTMHL